MTMHSNSEHHEIVSFGDLRQQIADGLLYTDSRLNANQRKTLEVARFLTVGRVAGR